MYEASLFHANPLVFGILASVLGLAGFYLLCKFFLYLYYFFTVKSWPTTEAVITTSRVDRFNVGGNYGSNFVYCAVIGFEYSIEGKKYNRQNIPIFEFPSFKNKSTADRLIGYYFIQKKVMISYFSLIPSESVLLRSEALGLNLGLVYPVSIFLNFFIFLGWGILFLWTMQILFKPCIINSPGVVVFMGGQQMDIQLEVAAIFLVVLMPLTFIMQLSNTKGNIQKARYDR